MTCRCGEKTCSHPLRSAVNLPPSSAWQIYSNRSLRIDYTRREIYHLSAARVISVAFFFSRKKWFRRAAEKIVIFADDKRARKRRIKVVGADFSFCCYMFSLCLSIAGEKTARGTRPSACRCSSLPALSAREKRTPLIFLLYYRFFTSCKYA